MLLKIKNRVVTFILLSIFFGCQLHAEEETLSEANLRKILAPLGSAIVGDSLPGVVINDPYKYVSGKPGTYTYKMLLTDDENTSTKFEIRSESENGMGKLRKWSLKIDNDFIEEWAADREGSIHLMAQTDINSGYRVVFSPHLLLPAGAQQGQRWKSESHLNVYEISEPDTIVYEGTLFSSKAYEGRFKITTPAGKYDAILISDDYEINIGAVNINDKRYTFYAPDVGKIAEIDGFHVSAFLFFHKQRNEVKVLMTLPHTQNE